jgi:hypothetical protein
LSQLEKTYFLILDNDLFVEDIKEQFPLPLESTQMLAARLGIKHPSVNGFSYVMTTDFMVKRNGHWTAIQIKQEQKNYRTNCPGIEYPCKALSFSP